jgi:hypothetical protein
MTMLPIMNSTYAATKVRRRPTMSLILPAIGITATNAMR